MIVRSIVVFILFSTLLSSLSDKEKATHKDLIDTNFECEAHRSPTWSPDGVRIAFTAVCSGNRDILVYDLDSEQLINVTQTKGLGELQPTWSPDGTRLAYDTVDVGIRTDIVIWSTVQNTSQNFTIDLELGNRFRNWSPNWSSNGKYLAFVSENSDRADIVIANLVTEDITIITEDSSGIFGHPVWSLDGEYLAFLSLDMDDPGLWIYSMETLQSEQIYQNPFWKITWSPNDNTLTMISQSIEHPITTIDLNGNIQTFDSILPYIDATSLSDLVWSNNGEFVAIVASDEAKRDIWIVDLTKEVGINITQTEEFDDLSPTWSPDDTQLAFVSGANGDSEIWIININGTNPQPIARRR